MFHPQGSKLQVNQELLIFDPPLVSSGVESVQYVSYLPTGQLSDDGPIEFVVPNTSPMYMDLSRTTLCVKAKVVKNDGSDLAQADIVTPTNLFMHSVETGGFVPKPEVAYIKWYKLCIQSND